jgi:hypothetical protein
MEEYYFNYHDTQYLEGYLFVCICGRRWFSKFNSTGKCFQCGLFNIYVSRRPFRYKNVRSFKDPQRLPVFMNYYSPNKSYNNQLAENFQLTNRQHYNLTHEEMIKYATLIVLNSFNELVPRNTEKRYSKINKPSRKKKEDKPKIEETSSYDCFDYLIILVFIFFFCFLYKHIPN